MDGREVSLVYKLCDPRSENYDVKSVYNFFNISYTAFDFIEPVLTRFMEYISYKFSGKCPVIKIYPSLLMMNEGGEVKLFINISTKKKLFEERFGERWFDYLDYLTLVECSKDEQGYFLTVETPIPIKSNLLTFLRK